MADKSLLMKASLILNALLANQTLSHDDLITYIKNNIVCMPNFKSLSLKDIEELSFEYEKLYGAKTFIPGTTLKSKKDGYDIWFIQKKNKMLLDDHKFENRYRKYLTLEHFAANAIENIFVDTEKILSLCADPTSTDKVRGLVMGDVQSGKTSNYLALASLACDYGYKLVLILAGLTDSLRIQTQERVDEGFIGAKSETIGNNIEYVGVGKLDESGNYYAIPLTTRKKDFETLSLSSPDLTKPVVLVVKKNKAVLTAVKQWLKPGSPNLSSTNILIIDDECDNASVNTKSDDDPSTINSLIRDIYNNYTCATYVGYTATPFANIFINPTKMIGNDDLFPSDFIHRLVSQKESYFGIDKVFKDKESAHLALLNEKEKNFLPVKHKKETEYPGLSRSLKDAILNFLICNCIRTLRGDKTKHRTMMINISSFNTMQEEIKDAVEIYINNLKNITFQYDKYKLDKFLKNDEMKRIHEIYSTDKLYTKINNEFSFDDIKKTLFEEISLFQVTVINNRYKGDQRFNYDLFEETGARVITIGGFILSRGLTLKGLMTSYYSRNASAYDTLLQMCRWFGYRPNYEDLCRVYMSQINVDSFGAVIEAIDKLDEQIEIMNVQGKTPIDFGYMVNESPDTLETNLLITARNKMKHTKVIERRINYSGVALDTSKLFKDPSINKKNVNSIDRLCERLKENNYKLEKINNRNMFRNVQPDIVSDFILSLYIPLENKKFDSEALASFIKTNDLYDKWDIVFATGNENGNDKYIIKYDDTIINPINRKFEAREDEDIIRISKNNNRLIEPGIFNSGLDDQQIKQAKENAIERGKLKKPIVENPDCIASDYLNVDKRNPLLVILPITLTADEEDDQFSTEEKIKINNSFAPDHLMGFAIGFAGKDGGAKTTYRINEVKVKQLRNKISDEEEEESDD